MSDDPKGIWQNRPTEVSAMTLNLIHRRIRGLKAKTRGQLLGHVALCITEIACFAYVLKSMPQLWPFLVVAIVWSLSGLFLMTRDIRSGTRPGDQPFTTGVDFYRAEIERRESFLRGGTVRVVGPAILAAGTFLFSVSGGRFDLLLKTLPFVSVLAVWAIGYHLIRRKEQRELKRELDELN